MNRNEIAFIHGGEREQEGFTLWCLSGRPFNKIDNFILQCYRLYLVKQTFLLWKIKKTPHKHMKRHYQYLGYVGHKRFFDCNFKEIGDVG